VHRVYKVDAVACSTSNGSPVGVKAGSIVLSAKTSGRGATFVQNLRGHRVRVGWRADSPGVLDIVSGNATILSHGKVRYATSCTKSICNRNPRTAIGVTANDRVVMMVVDGRTSASVGFTLHRLGEWMRRMGAVDAINLDGGGSATMWIKGKGVVNHPTDSTGERPVSNAVVVLPHRDRQESEPLPPH
jgi:exopolysaccharide biosynthesis protein